METTIATLDKRPAIPTTASTIDITREIFTFNPTREVKISSDVLASDLWGNILDQTQKDQRERGIVVSWDGNGNQRIVSNIFLGERGTITFPPFPHGLIKAFMPKIKELAWVHSHFLPENHLRTGTLSQKDIDTFCNSDSKVSIAIDRGGAHLLIKADQEPNIHPNKPRPDIISSALKKIKEQKGELEEFIKEIARGTQESGMIYYYAPSKTIDPSSKEITFRNVLEHDNFLKD